MKANNSMSIGDLLNEAKKALDETSESPSLDAQVLLQTLLDQRKAWIMSHKEFVVNQKSTQIYRDWIKRRIQGEPIAHILGYKEFWSIELTVNENVLIPRPETELLVERALDKIPIDARWRIADLGTGSGAIALAIAKERPHCNVIATDISEPSLDLARLNAQRLGLSKIEFLFSHWYENLNETFDLVISNPPYISTQDKENLDLLQLQYEPYEALYSGPVGLDALEHIITNAGDYLNTRAWLIVEHGFDQQSAVHQLFKQAGFTGIKNSVDLSGHPRVTEGIGNIV